MKLYYSFNANPRLSVATAKYLNSPVSYIKADPQNPANKKNFKALNPNALVPVFEENGATLWEADAIACRLSAIAKSNFWRVGDAQPEMIRWISWATHHLNRAADPLYFFRVVWPTFMKTAPPQNEIDKGEKDFRRHARVLEGYLHDRHWLVGDEISYADFRVGTFLPYADAAAIPLSEFPNMLRWHNQLMELDAWRTPFAGL